jgi:hypothetical protein
VRCDHSPSYRNLGWSDHRLPIAFRLMIAQDPYQYDVLAEVDMTRGGDDGDSECGGYGNFASSCRWQPPTSKLTPAGEIPNILSL